MRLFVAPITNSSNLLAESLCPPRYSHSGLKAAPIRSGYGLSDASIVCHVHGTELTERRWLDDTLLHLQLTQTVLLAHCQDQSRKYSYILRTSFQPSYRFGCFEYRRV